MKKIINMLLIISMFTFGMNAYAGEEASDMSYCPISVFGDTFYAIKMMVLYGDGVVMIKAS